MYNNFKETKGSFFIPTDKDSECRIFAGRIISLYDLMIELNFPEIQRRIAQYSFKFKLNPEETYENEQWDEFFAIADLCRGKDEPATKNDRRPYLPKTKEKALEIADEHRIGIMWMKEPQGQELLFEWGNLRRSFEADLRSIFLWELDDEEIRFFRSEGYDSFSPLALSRFDTIKSDIWAAGRCYAFGEYTACVFHISRATEIVTQKIAIRFDVSPDWPDKHCNPKHTKDGKKGWGDFITCLERKLGVSADFSEIKDFEMRGHLANMLAASRVLKALRNSTDHVYLLLSEFYDKEKALDIWRQTKNFIESAAQIPEAPNLP